MKHWRKSKTLLFNLLITLLIVVSESSDLVKAVIADDVGYNRIMLFVALANTYLRLVSSKAISWKKPKIRSPTP